MGVIFPQWVVTMQGEWHRPEVNRHSVWQAYVDSYNNHAFGILQENCQNSFDAFSEDTPIRDMKILIKYDSDLKILSHRDFNTKGMGHCQDCNWGIKQDGSVCTNPKCSWGAFHNMGFTAKGGTDLGSRGMGKSLQLLSGNRTTVITTLPTGESQASLWDKESGDWQWRLAPESVKKLSSPGTEIVTNGIINSVHLQFLGHRSIIAELQEQWFSLIEKGATIEYILIRNQKMERYEVPKLRIPDLDTSQGGKEAKSTISVLIVTYHGERVGELQNLNIFLAKEEFNEDDPRFGIAIIKNGKQTITRFNEFPPEIPERVRNRIFGFCNAVCTDNEPFLKSAETSQHTGYQWSNPVWKATRTQLRDVVRQFVQPFMRSGGERVSEVEQEEGKEILTVFNEALKFVPNFSLFGRDLVSTIKKVETSPKNYLYLSRIEYDNRSYKRGENALIDAIIKNPLPQEVLVVANFEHFDPTPVVVEFDKKELILPPGSPSDPGTNKISWKLSFDQSQAPGIHWIQVSLRNIRNEPFKDDKGNDVKGRRQIYCELEPRKIERTRTGTGSPKNGTGKGGGEGEFGLVGIQIFKKPEMKDDLEAYIDQSQGIAFFNWYGRRFDFARRGSKNKKSTWPIVGEVIAEELLKLKASSDAGEKEEWSSEEVKNKVAELEQSKAKLVRKMVELLG